jgi:hypothetical protein
VAESPVAVPTPGVVADAHGLLKACVVRNGAMELVDIDYAPATGDTTASVLRVLRGCALCERSAAQVVVPHEFWNWVL